MRLKIIAGLATLAVAGMLATAGTTSASAASTTPLYAYNFNGASGTVSNDGSVSGATLTLNGDWTANSTGVEFANDQVDDLSNANWAPSSGNTINIPGDDLAAIGAQFQFESYSGTTCTGNPHIAAVGRDVNNPNNPNPDGEMKIQLHTCQTGNNYAECRISGNQDFGETVITSTLALTNLTNYNVYCWKTADNSSGGPHLYIDVVNDHTDTGTVNSKPISASGHITVGQNYAPDNAVSVGNKTPSDGRGSTNVDGFNGTIYTAAVCDVTSLDDMYTCFGSEFQSLS